MLAAWPSSESSLSQNTPVQTALVHVNGPVLVSFCPWKRTVQTVWEAGNLSLTSVFSSAHQDMFSWEASPQMLDFFPAESCYLPSSEADLHLGRFRAPWWGSSSCFQLWKFIYAFRKNTGLTVRGNRFQFPSAA